MRFLSSGQSKMSAWSLFLDTMRVSPCGLGRWQQEQYCSWAAPRPTGAGYKVASTVVWSAGSVWSDRPAWSPGGATCIPLLRPAAAKGSHQALLNYRTVLILFILSLCCISTSLCLSLLQGTCRLSAQGSIADGATASSEVNGWQGFQPYTLAMGLFSEAIISRYGFKYGMQKWFLKQEVGPFVGRIALPFSFSDEENEFLKMYIFIWKRERDLSFSTSLPKWSNPGTRSQEPGAGFFCVGGQGPNGQTLPLPSLGH